MKIEQAIKDLQKVKSSERRRSAHKTCDHFIAILSDLSGRPLPINHIQLIESELDNLKLEELLANSGKDLAKKLERFKKFLRDKFSFIHNGYYAEVGVAFGIMIGLVASTLFRSFFGSYSYFNIYSLLIGFNGGLITGLLVGIFLDAEARKKNRVLGLEK
jgi:hypothetical protein